MKFKFAIVLIFLFFVFSACITSQQNQDDAKLHQKDVYSLADGSVLKVKIGDEKLKLVVANTPIAKENGLSNKKHIPEDGMIFFFYEPQTLSFWMKEMNFPIDIIWILGDTVVGIEKNIPAPDADTAIKDLKIYRSNDKADTVVELEAGTADKLNIVPGSILEFEYSK